MVSAYKKKQMMVAGGLGLALGFFASFIFFVPTNNFIAFTLCPIAGLIGVAQAYLAPEPD